MQYNIIQYSTCIASIVSHRYVYSKSYKQNLYVEYTAHLYLHYTSHQMFDLCSYETKSSERLELSRQTSRRMDARRLPMASESSEPVIRSAVHC